MDTSPLVIPAETYENRRKRLMKLLGNGLLIIPPHPHLIYSNDKHVRYRPNSNTVYFSGITQHETIIVLDLAEYKTFLFILDADKEKEQWNGKRINPDTAGEISGIQMIYPISEFTVKLKDLITRTNQIHYPPKINQELFEEVERIVEDIDRDIPILDPSHRFDVIRLIKDNDEVDLIKKSIAISVDAHLEAIQQTEIGMTEYELEAIYANHFRINGAILPTYQAIVAAGENSTILHHHASSTKFTDGDLVLVDTGCEYQYYTSDIARTWPVSGTFSPEQKEIYEIVLNTHKACLAMVEPGVKFWDIHEKAVHLLSQGLIDLGIYSFDLDFMIEKQIYKEFFMHGIGHFLGMDGHDTPNIDREDVTLQPGMYITIEPGIYLSSNLDIPAKYHDIGIRIEDNVLVTEDGSDNLSKSLPVEIEDLEEIIGSDLN